MPAGYVPAKGERLIWLERTSCPKSVRLRTFPTIPRTSPKRAGFENLDSRLSEIFCLTAARVLVANQEAKMTKRTRRNHTPGFKAKVAVGCHEGRQDAGRTGSAFRCAPEPDHAMAKPRCWEGAAGLFGADRGETKAAPSVDLKALRPE